MTRPKKSDRPFCRIQVLTDEKEPPVTMIEWPDFGKERVAARITKALKYEGYEAKTARTKLDKGRVCFIMTVAPVEVVRGIVGDLFLDVRSDPSKSTRNFMVDFYGKLDERKEEHGA